MKKIAYISSAYFADCDLPLLRELRNEGNDVYYFLMMSDSSRQATIIDVKKMKERGGVIPASEYKELSIVADYMPLDRTFVVNMPEPHDWALGSLKAIYSLYVFLRNGSFDIIHLTSPLRYGAFLLYGMRKKMVLTMHDPLPHSSDVNSMNIFHRNVAFRLIDNFIVLSESLKDEFISTYHLERKNVYVSSLSVYTHLLATPTVDLNVPKRYILFAGSINPHKGIKYLCEAMRTIKSNGSDLHLVIAGKGNFDFDIESYIADGNVHIINRYITNPELATLIRRSLFVVCPYIDATQSGVIMSSFALNKPVLATDVGALKEMLTNGRHGYLVPPRSSSCLSSTIIEMDDSVKLRQMCDNIRTDYTEGNRSWKKIAEEMVSFYDSI